MKKIKGMKKEIKHLRKELKHTNKRIDQMIKKTSGCGKVDLTKKGKKSKDKQ